jgi:FkbM family methyltransferase
LWGPCADQRSAAAGTRRRRRGLSRERQPGMNKDVTWKDAMTSRYYSALARVRLVLRSKALSPLRRSVEATPFLRHAGPRVKLALSKVLLPQSAGWVRVEAGLAKGLWMRLRFFGEGSYWLGCHEAVVQELLKQFCRPGSVCYDIGAHVGFFSLGLAQCVGPEGKVFAFEPDPENCARLKETMVRNDFEDRVELVEAAVWSRTCSRGIPFRCGSSKAHGGVCADGLAPVLADAETRLVPGISLDDFIRKGNSVPDVVKIDVEGGECEVLKGGEQLFSQSSATLLCEVHHEQATRWITGWLTAKGYVAEWRVPKESYPRLLLAWPGTPR